MKALNLVINIIVLITLIVTLSGCNTREESIAEIEERYHISTDLKASNYCSSLSILSDDYNECYAKAYDSFHPFR